MLEGLLPDAVCWATASVSTAEAGQLLGVERDVIATAAPIRVREFTAGRAAARQALARLGVPAVALPVGPSRAPAWPAGIVGSITHCDSLAAAAVARATDVAAVGLDAEPARPVGPDVVDVVATVAERLRLRDPLGATVLFSAKEAFYKCWSACGGPMLEFDDVSVEVLDDGDAAGRGGRLVACPRSGGRWSGRWGIRAGFVLTAVWCPAGAP